MPKNKRSELLEVARQMPPLRHSRPGQDFDIRNSETINWLVQQPEILNYIWNNVKNSDAVSYDPQTGTWTGADYDD